MKIVLKNQSEMEDFAAELGQRLLKFSIFPIIALVGDLGAGKTTLVKGLAKFLGIKKVVISPTFLILKSYPVKKRRLKNLVHVDAYRIGDSDLMEIGFFDYLNQLDNLVVIEWADKIKSLIPKNSVWIKIKVGLKTPTSRTVQVVWSR